eukprot:scaffold5_cov331-Pavlova_lutheri.AAC.65
MGTGEPIRSIFPRKREGRAAEAIRFGPNGANFQSCVAVWKDNRWCAFELLHEMDGFCVRTSVWARLFGCVGGRSGGPSLVCLRTAS